MEDIGFVQRLFSSVDNMDTEAFLDFLEEDALFRFGSEQVVTGKEAIRRTIEGFFASIKGLRHEIMEIWFESGTIICHGEVTYTRTDGSDITIPFVNIFRMCGNRIREYLIYIDIKLLYSSAC